MNYLYVHDQNFRTKRTEQKEHITNNNLQNGNMMIMTIHVKATYEWHVSKKGKNLRHSTHLLHLAQKLLASIIDCFIDSCDEFFKHSINCGLCVRGTIRYLQILKRYLNKINSITKKKKKTYIEFWRQ